VVEGDPADPATQSRIVAALEEVVEWRRFMAALPPVGLRPL
jgi:hypothetical protein